MSVVSFAFENLKAIFSRESLGRNVPEPVVGSMGSGDERCHSHGVGLQGHSILGSLDMSEGGRCREWCKTDLGAFHSGALAGHHLARVSA